MNRAKDFNPFWSPDGKTIAFISNRDGHNEIYIMNEDGLDPRRLTWGVTDKGRDRHRWSPDGSKIGYVAFVEHGSPGRSSIDAARQRELFSASDD
jgi:TolB protein